MGMFNGNDEKIPQVLDALEASSNRSSQYALLRLALRGFPMHEVQTVGKTGHEVGLYSSRVLIAGLVYFQEPSLEIKNSFERSCESFNQWANRSRMYRYTTIGSIAQGTAPASEESLWSAIHYTPFIPDPILSSPFPSVSDENHRKAFQLEHDLLELFLQDLHRKPSFAPGPALWPNSTRQDVHDVTSRRIESKHPPVSQGFWKRWHASYLAGAPLDWDLQRRVALIPDGTWQSGPDAVAEAIARIEALFAVETALAELAKERAEVRAVRDRLGIGGNGAPAEYRLEPEIQRATTIIWAAVDDIQEQVQAETPDKAVIERALGALRSGLGVLLKWCGRKADLAVDSVIKWGAPATAAGYADLNPDKMSALVKAVENWLPFLN
jgi:hypothetical protein